ncbi:DUF155-domain-containing protein [Aureobasidium sp. EXF-10727]|nr:DUF155-domain-containing protein [Aureobasidium sp. EXF-10727]
MAAPVKKRGPTVLVTDAREQQPQRPSTLPRTGTTKLISVDNVLQFSSDIPSAQRRGPPGGLRPAQHTRTPSGRHPLDPKLAGRSFAIPVGGPHIPARSSKVSEKLVLLPETSEKTPSEEDEDEDDAPPSDEQIRRRKSPRIGDKSYAERLPKASRADKLARVTAYCTAQSYRLRATADFVREQHGARTKLYDDCLYAVYQLPLLGGSDGYRIRSSPVLKNPGGRSILDEQIEANERRDHREGWMEESDEYTVHGNARDHEEPNFRRHSHSSDLSSGGHGTIADALSVAELYVFSYGVAVFWNFTAHQEKDILADLTFSSSSNIPTKLSTTSSPALTNTLGLVSRPLSEADFETEDFHFEYNDEIDKPRIFNDMITLRTNDHMIKLAMSHAISQSTKLSYFEERMQRTMSEAQYVPRKLALEGQLGMSRSQVVSLVGKLFQGRVDVNLSSNMLDTPNFFWDSEPTLLPLYAAVREYLEIKPRIQVLNERCKVFLDLAEILSDAIADTKMTKITWIVIVLIVISILVTCSEVILRFAILSKGEGQGAASPSPREL